MMKKLALMNVCILLLNLALVASDLEKLVVKAEKDRIEHLVAFFWNAAPVTVTSAYCERSAGGVHDFYSEGDYWWSDPKDPEGPYIRRDGMSNPDNFSDHRHAMIMIRVFDFQSRLCQMRVQGNIKLGS